MSDTPNDDVALVDGDPGDVTPTPVVDAPVIDTTAPVNNTPPLPDVPAPVVAPKPKAKLIDDVVPTVHTISGRDTLDSIAATYGIDPNQLLGWNIVELDRQAIARGLADSESGRHLFPGGDISLQPLGKQANNGVQPASGAAELQRYHNLFVQGVLTEDEWLVKKAELLA